MHVNHGPFTRRRAINEIRGLRGELGVGAVAREMRLGKMVARGPAPLPQTTSEGLFAISGGRVLITNIIGEVTTVIQNQANNTKLVYDPTGAGSNTDLCAVLNIANLAVGVYLTITGTLATAMVSGVRRALLMATPQILETGAIQLNCAASNTGDIKWNLWYVPLDEGAAVVATDS